MRHRRSFALLAAFWLAAGHATAQDGSLHERLAAIDDLVRVTPQRAQSLLENIAPEARNGTPAERAEYFILSCDIEHRLGRHTEAVGLCEQAIAIGRRVGDNAIVASGVLSKAYAVFGLGQAAQSHQLAWEAERLANTTGDLPLRVRTGLTSGESYAEDGNFPLALSKIQNATTLARQSGDAMSLVMALRTLAKLYDQLREYDKGFDVLAEAERVAQTMPSPERRLVLLKSVEYALAIDSGQLQRALKVELTALDLLRKLDATQLIGVALVNLADCYLKLHDYRNALAYAEQALVQGRILNDDLLAATARSNIGQAYLALGRLAEGKKNIEASMAWFEKTGHKPDLQSNLVEYGEALERAGDLAGALSAYHRERTLSNELYETRRQKAMVEMQEKYEADKRKRQIESLRQENQVKSTELDNRRLQQRIWWLLLLVGTLVVVIVGLLYRKVRQANARLEEKNEELKLQSARDPLTALYNRRHFQEFMRGHQVVERRAIVERTPAEDLVGAMFLLDVDHFKHINDTYGHGAGDAVLREIAVALREILRETDMIVRWGGEEFLAFLPAVPRAGLDEVARRLLAGIPARTIHYQGVPLSVNVSVGFAPFPLAPGAGMVSWERAVNIVDMALYLAKGHGRNRAYGVRSAGPLDAMAMDEIEQDIEQAWRDGRVELSVVTPA